MPLNEFDSVELIPDDSRISSADDELNTVESLLDFDPDVDDDALPDTPDPYGKSWLFDFSTGQFQRVGSSPAETHGLDSLRQWVLLAMSVEQGAHEIFEEDFGIEDLNGMIGLPYNPALAAQYQRHVTEALLIHDRIVDVSDFDFQFNELEEYLECKFVIQTDQDEYIPIASALASSSGGEE